MKKYCAVLGCFNCFSNLKSSKFLPNDETEVQKWSTHLKLRPFNINGKNFICEEHYKKVKCLEDLPSDLFINPNPNIDNFCRLCGSLPQDESLIHIFNKNFHEQFSKEFIHFMLSFLSLEIDKKDIFPKTVCIDCFSKITDIIAFRNLCRRVNDYFQMSIKLDDYENSQFEENAEMEIDNHTSVKLEDKTLDMKHKCSKCKKRFPTRGIQAYHSRICRSNDEGHLGNDGFKTCPICNAKVLYLERHMVYHSADKKFDCEICEKKFYKRTALHEHLESHNEKNLKCPNCDLYFQGKITLGRHQRHKHNESALRHMCEFCSKKFFKPGELKVHLGIHHGINSFECRFCDESFKHSKVLNTHLERVHNKRKTSKKERLSKYFTEFNIEYKK